MITTSTMSIRDFLVAPRKVLISSVKFGMLVMSSPIASIVSREGAGVGTSLGGTKHLSGVEIRSRFRT